MSSPSIFERIEKAREFLKEGDYFRILTHYDVDGVCSAGILAAYLLRNNKRFHISFFRNSESSKILEIVEKSEYTVLTDMGSSLVKNLKGKVLVLDHHKPAGDNDKILHINPHLFGYDGAKDACATTLSYLVVDDPTYARFFMAGVFGDKQHLSGFSGLNEKIISELKIDIVKDLAIYGSVTNAIVYSTDPFFPNLSGRPENVEKLLQKLKISPGKDIRELSENEKVKLGSALSLSLIKNSKNPEAGKMIVDIDANLGGSVRYLSELIDAAARTDNQSIAMGYILGEKRNYEKMEILRRDYKSEIISAVYDMLENVFEMSHLQYFFVGNTYLTGSVSTIAALYLLDPDKPVLALYKGSESIHISAREHRKLAKKVHLGDILKKVATEFGGVGGGHNVAAGVTIPHDAEDAFLEKVNSEIEKCLS